MQTLSLEGACDYAEAPVNMRSQKYVKYITNTALIPL
jgi:hypothetical protein